MGVGDEDVTNGMKLNNSATPPGLGAALVCTSAVVELFVINELVVVDVGLPTSIFVDRLVVLVVVSVLVVDEDVVEMLVEVDRVEVEVIMLDELVVNVVCEVGGELEEPNVLV